MLLQRGPRNEMKTSLPSKSVEFLWNKGSKPFPFHILSCRGWGSPQPCLNQICGTANQGAIKIYLLFIISKLPECCLGESGKLKILLTHWKSTVWCPANPKFVFIALILKLCLSNYICALMKKMQNKGKCCRVLEICWLKTSLCVLRLNVLLGQSLI